MSKDKKYTTIGDSPQVDEEMGTASAASSTESNSKGTTTRYPRHQLAPKKAKKHIHTSNNRQQSKKCCFQKIALTKLLTARILFILCLAGVAGGLGYAAHTFLTRSEQALAESQFTSIAERALAAAQAITLRKRMGGVSLASIFSNIAPHADDWPNVALDGFDGIAQNLISTSDGRGMGFMPIVYPEQLASFEDFAYNYYETQQRPPFEDPSSIAQSSFGRGVYGVDPSLNTSDNRYHATGNYTTWGGQNNFSAPMFQVVGPPGSAATQILLFDHYSRQDRGRFVDDLKNCSDQRQASGDLSTQCTSLSDALFILGQPHSPGAIIFEPIYPANDPDVFTGYISSSIIWEEVLENVFAEDVSGIACILQTETQNHEYRITDGHPTYIGERIHDEDHPRKHCEARGVKPMSIVLTGEGLFTEASATYTLKLYPTQEFFETYSTRNPVSATVGAVVIIIFTSLAFLVYDALVRQEFNDARAVLEAKRQFMRYVSHEVRTPLNTVVMGLKLLQDEVSALVCGKRPQIGNGDSTNEKRAPDGDPAVVAGKDMESQPEETQSDSIIDLSNRILTSAESAVSVLNDLLNYDKIEMGELPLELTIIPIWSLIEKSMAEFMLPFQAKKINFSLDFSSLVAQGDELDIEAQSEPIRGAKNLPQEVLERRVVGDAIRLTQVLRNLTSNALKFTPENGSVSITVSWRRPDPNQVPVEDEFVLHDSETPVSFLRDGWLQVKVKDSGVGMTEDQLSRLFQRGLQFNANELQAGKGSGLGLYIAKGICERHGGSLIPSSEGLGKGTTFTLAIPLHHVPDKALPNHCRRASLGQKTTPVKTGTISNRNLEKSGSSPEEEGGQLRILVVDDAAMNRKLLSRLLTNSGHKCDQAEDGQQAVDKVKASLSNNCPYQVILLDFEMPVMNGPDAAKAIREDLGCTETFIGGVTGNVLPDDVAHFKRCGADWVFCKPVRINDLEAIWMDYGVISGSGESVVEEPSNTQGTAVSHATDEP